jgi:dTDP-4-dehydrorhamnose reductase
LPTSHLRLPLALWGGHECTVNRVGDAFADQSERSGHAARIEDLDAFAALGLRTLRYPILWEQVSPDSPERCDWERHDARMARLRALGVSPIVGLVHHGSGPAYTDLLSATFAPGLTRHAARVAERYPWVEAWTPVNEPVTTARFAALYGHWYPHARDERSFWLALLNQIDAVRGAMVAIRAVIPQARLVQTDDLGRTYATAPLTAQADFDNDRRWAGWDLLCGRLTAGHRLWERLVGYGFEERLCAIADAPCRPDIIGINHYLTSDRFLDHRTDRFPPAARGTCSFGPVADVEAVRAVSPEPAGVAGALHEAWERYGLPLALTEIHLACTREEQIRWLAEAWDIASALRDEGLDIVAVTAWSLLGASDWASLLTRADGHYESGVFDVSAGAPRPTALAGLVRDLAAGRAPRHHLLAQAGWWRKDERLLYAPHDIMPVSRPTFPARRAKDARLLILGATGTLGQAFAGACRLRDIPYVLTSRCELSLDDPRGIGALLDSLRPWAVVNAAGWVRVDDAEAEETGCFAANYEGAVRLATACAARAIPLTSFSSDLVFDGSAQRPYIEGDLAAPLSVYGRAKARADAALLAIDADMLVIRTASFFSPFDGHNFASQLVTALRDNRPFRAADDVVSSPTYVPDLVRVTLDLMIDGETGLWHLVNAGSRSWAGFARAIASALDLDRGLIEAAPQRAMGWLAARPGNAALASVRTAIMPDLEDAIARFAAHV